MSISVETLVNLAQLLELCAERGAFTINEFTSVGRTYEALSEYLEHRRPGAVIGKSKLRTPLEPIVEDTESPRRPN